MPSTTAPLVFRLLARGRGGSIWPIEPGQSACHEASASTCWPDCAVRVRGYWWRSFGMARWSRRQRHHLGQLPVVPRPSRRPTGRLTLAQCDV